MHKLQVWCVLAGHYFGKVPPQPECNLVQCSLAGLQQWQWQQQESGSGSNSSVGSLML
jgi:hypothetical protein